MNESSAMAPGHADHVAFYMGGFEAVGGIEAFLEDLLMSGAGQSVRRSLFVWANPVPALGRIAQAGCHVRRVSLRSGCRYGLPDRMLYFRHGAAPSNADRIIFAKLPPEPVFRRIISQARAGRSKRAELSFVTPYRPAEMFANGLPELVRTGLDRIMVQGSGFASDLREMGFEGNIDVLPYVPPLAAERPAPADGDGRLRLGFLGRFVPQKNLSYLLEIMERLKGEPIELHLFGGGQQEQPLRECAAAGALSVTFHGVVAREAVPQAIDSCDVFINPSKSEGQCLVALEVLSRGRALLASGVGAIPEILSKGRFGTLVPLDDADGAAGVVRAFRDQWLNGNWPAHAIADAYARAYPRDAIIQEYDRLFFGERPGAASQYAMPRPAAPVETGH